MQVAVVDSNILISFASARDRHHEAGTAIVQGIDRGVLPTAAITNYVVTETLNFVHERRRRGVAKNLYDRLDRGSRFQFVHATTEDFHRAVELFQTYDGLSFGDATTVAYMHRTGIRYLYSFDDDFDAVEGIVRLGTAANPFRPS